jgi:transposase-like protein
MNKSNSYTHNDFEEDEEPTWLLKQREDALLAQKAYEKNTRIVHKKGDQVGNFLFVAYNKCKNRATYECQECGRKFTSNIYSIKNKKRCKWYKFHDKKFQ